MHDSNRATPLKDMLVLLVITKLYKTVRDCRTSRRYRSTSQGVEAMRSLNPSQLFELQMVGQTRPMRRDFSLTSIFMQLMLPKMQFLFPVASGRGNLQLENVHLNLFQSKHIGFAGKTIRKSVLKVQ